MAVLAVIVEHKYRYIFIFKKMFTVTNKTTTQNPDMILYKCKRQGCCVYRLYLREGQKIFR